MIYACRRCQYEEARGCIPTVSCGIFLIGLFGITLGQLLVMVEFLFPDGLAWWWFLAGPLLFLAAVARLMVVPSSYWQLLNGYYFVCVDVRNVDTHGHGEFTRGFGL